MSGNNRITCFGEMLLRLAAPRGEVLRGTHDLGVFVGGAEANVAIALARLGNPSAMITVVPENSLGELCKGELRRQGVDTELVTSSAGRMGLYFHERGAGLRPARVVYDRAHSAFAQAVGGAQPWDRLLKHSSWLHVSGITAALSAVASDTLIAGVRAARARGVPVSFDCNYRPSLWQGRAVHAGGILREIAGQCDVLFANVHDLALMLEQDVPSRQDDAEVFTQSARAALARFAQLRLVATTSRTERGADDQSLSGMSVGRDGVFSSRTYRLHGIVERIGSGDAFAAGVLHGTLSGLDPARTIEFGAACACLKHFVPTDFSQATAGEVEALLRGETAMTR